MTVRFSNGLGHLFDKETPDFAIAKINYQLTETDPTKFSKRRWWGDFSTGDQLKHSGNFYIEFEEGRRGEIVVIPDTEASSKKAQTWYYHFNGRSSLSRKR